MANQSYPILSLQNFPSSDWNADYEEEEEERRNSPQAQKMVPWFQPFSVNTQRSRPLLVKTFTKAPTMGHAPTSDTTPKPTGGFVMRGCALLDVCDVVFGDSEPVASTESATLATSTVSAAPETPSVVASATSDEVKKEKLTAYESRKSRQQFAIAAREKHHAKDRWFFLAVVVVCVAILITLLGRLLLRK